MKKTLFLLALLLLIPSFAMAQSCTQSFTTSSAGGVGSAISSGNSNTILCFASGTYGDITISNAHPSGMVTISPAPGATVNMGMFTLSGVSNLTITGFSGSSSSDGLLAQGNNSNITFSYNAMSSNGVVIRDNTIANSNILIDHDTFVGFSGLCETCRIHIFNNACPQSGITISNSIMAGGSDDGAQWGGCGVKFINNELYNLTGNSGGIHQDALQGVGDSNSVITGNYIHSVANCWQLTDGTSNITMTDNICIADGSDGHSGQLCSQTADFENNTIVSAGGINVGNDSQGHSSSNFTVKNNIFNGQLVVNSGQSFTGTTVFDYNLCYTGGCSGSHSISGKPTYVGGSSPSTYDGFALTSASLGHNAGSDGKDMGISATTTTLNLPAAPTGLTVSVQ